MEQQDHFLLSRTSESMHGVVCAKRLAFYAATGMRVLLLTSS
jgi:hypothetical protein